MTLPQDTSALYRILTQHHRVPEGSDIDLAIKEHDDLIRIYELERRWRRRTGAQLLILLRSHWQESVDGIIRCQCSACKAAQDFVDNELMKMKYPPDIDLQWAHKRIREEES